VYELTDWGRELGPVLVQLGRWGTLRALVIDGAPLDGAERDGRLQLAGDRSVVERLLHATRGSTPGRTSGPG
jgi:hypothetical protein